MSRRTSIDAGPNGVLNFQARQITGFSPCLASLMVLNSAADLLQVKGMCDAIWAAITVDA